MVPDWQTAASNLLSTLGKKFPKEVLQELLTKFHTGQLPHFFVVSTLGQLATANGQFWDCKMSNNLLAVISTVHSSNIIVVQ